MGFKITCIFSLAVLFLFIYLLFICLHGWLVLYTVLLLVMLHFLFCFVLSVVFADSSAHVWVFLNMFTLTCSSSMCALHPRGPQFILISISTPAFLTPFLSLGAWLNSASSANCEAFLSSCSSHFPQAFLYSHMLGLLGRKPQLSHWDFQVLIVSLWEELLGGPSRSEIRAAPCCPLSTRLYLL